MKKKFIKVLAMLLFVPVLLTGCITLVRSSYKEFSAVETELSAWGFYGNVDKGRQAILTEYEFLRGTNTTGYGEYYNYLDSQKPLYDMLRIGVTAVELKSQTSSQSGRESFFDFEDMQGYTIKREGTTDQYTINFKRPLTYGNLSSRDFKVDSVFDKIYFTYEVKVSVTAVSSARGQSNISVRSFVITPPTQAEIDAVKSSFNKDEIETEKTTTYNLTSQVTSNIVEISASKIEVVGGEQTSTYTKTVKFTRGSNITIKSTLQNSFGTQEKESRLPATNPINGFSVTYNQIEGYLGWNMTHTFGGEVKYYGEAYFQGNKKFLVKEVFDVVGLNAMGFASSIVNEVRLDDTDFYLKTIRGNSFTSLKTQNVLKVGMYDNEPQAYLFSRDRALKVPVFQKFG